MGHGPASAAEGPAAASPLVAGPVSEPPEMGSSVPDIAQRLFPQRSERRTSGNHPYSGMAQIRGTVEGTADFAVSEELIHHNQSARKGPFGKSDSPYFHISRVMFPQCIISFRS